MKRPLLWLAAIATAALSLNTYLHDTRSVPLEPVAAVAKAPRAPTLAAQPVTPAPRGEVPKAQFDPFFPTHPAVLRAPPPPPPMVQTPVKLLPELPFRFVGRTTNQDGSDALYLQRADELMVVEKGMVIEGMYRVEKIDATRVVFTYLPSNEVQEMPLPATSSEPSTAAGVM